MNDMLHTYKCKITRIIDADTLVADIDLGFGIKLGNQRVRLAGIDTPSPRSKDEEVRHLADQAKRYVEKMINESTTATIKSIGQDSFGRILGIINLYDESGETTRFVGNLNCLLKIKGLAVVYHHKLDKDGREQLIVETLLKK